MPDRETLYSTFMLWEQQQQGLRHPGDTYSSRPTGNLENSSQVGLWASYPECVDQ